MYRSKQYWMLALLSIVILTLGLCAAALAEPEAIPDTGLGWELDDNGTLTISVMDSSKSLDMPNYQWNDLTARPWFLETYKVNTIVIKSGVTRVGNLSFYETEAANIIFEEPCKVTAIGDYAFQPEHNYNDKCTALTIPASVQSIGEYAFHDFKRCHLTFAESETAGGSLSLGKACFGDLNNNIKSTPYVLTLPKRLTSLGTQCFAHAKISSVNIPETVTEIKPMCFFDCPTLTKIVFYDPSKIKQIQANAFSGVSSDVVVENQTGDLNALVALRDPSITDPSGNTAFINALPDGGSCDENNSESTIRWLFDPATGELIISGSGDMPDYSPRQTDRPWAEYLKKIDKITIKSGITRVGDYAFLGVRASDIVFENTAEHPSQLKSIGVYAFFQEKVNTTCTSLVFPESLENIEDGAFATYLKCKVTFLQSDTGAQTLKLGDHCFGYLNWQGNPYPLELPSRLTSIGNECFLFASIDSVIFSQNLAVIGESAFKYCRILEKITFADAGKVQSIQGGAFYEIPGNVVVENQTGDPSGLAHLKKVTDSRGNDNFLAALPGDGVVEFSGRIQWTGTAEGDKQPEIELVLYRDGQKVDVAPVFDQYGSFHFYGLPTSTTPYYVLESAVAGYSTSYENYDEYSGVTDRVLNGGTIINHKLPKTGDSEPLALYGLLLIAAAGGIVIIMRKRKHG